MSKKAIIAIIAVVLVAVATVGIFVVRPMFNTENTPQPNTSNENISGDLLSGNTTNNAGDRSRFTVGEPTNSTSTSHLSEYVSNESSTNEEKPSETQVSNENQAPELPAVENSSMPIRQEGIGVTPAGARQMEKIVQLGPEDMKARCAELITRLRNFDAPALADTLGWRSRIMEFADLELAKTKTQSNIVFQETDDSWLVGASTYPEWRSATRYVNVLNVYMDKVDGVETPAATVETEEDCNTDYPYPNSNHWKPIDHVRKQYIVYFTQDGQKIYYVKLMDKEVLESNITGVDMGPGLDPHGLVPNYWLQTEGKLDGSVG